MLPKIHSASYCLNRYECKMKNHGCLAETKQQQQTSSETTCYDLMNPFNQLHKKSQQSLTFPRLSSINGLTAHYRRQKYTVTVSHLFYLQPSRCVWASVWQRAEGCECFNAVCGMWRWTTLHLDISHLLASGDDEQVGGESAATAEP